MYLIRVDHLTYTRRDGTPFTLPEAMRELRGTGNAAVLRLDGTVAVRNAGSDTAVVHGPTGRVVRRTRTYRRVPRMTTVYTPAEDIAVALAAVGLKAHAEYGPAPTEVEIVLDGAIMKLCRDLNREDGGWEAAVERRPGEQDGLLDGPLPDASPAAVVAWVIVLIADGLTPV